ncbi:hypothetical protein D9611_004012 [Ephemerocybe angulata]|uniref:Uncharacterized protein n=1 Tax=Ephemerocybe angulata TaxID=980116 RepID=A0A8H5EYR3_9AGAR|nr:hypothetical protein D9611_004012 [Tulosesus angulatus]
MKLVPLPPTIDVFDSHNMAQVSQQVPFDMDLCSLLQTMKLDERQEWGNAYDSQSRSCPKATLHDDTVMVEDPNYHSDEGSDCSVPSSSILAPPPAGHFGCAYLQMIRSQIDEYPTTGGEYVEAIFTHREILSALPAAHRDCARGFTDIAVVLEKRAWRADRDADTEAVSAFRHEAWVIANTIPPAARVESRPMYKTASVCMLPPAY